MSLYDAHRLLNDRVVVSGAINEASTFAFSWAMLVMSVFMILCLITGKNLLWIPKIFIIILGGISVLAFLSGWKTNEVLKAKLNEKGYVECASERELTLKSSSRTYVLDPSMCQ